MSKARVRGTGGKEGDDYLEYSEFEVSVGQWFSEYGPQSNSGIIEELARKANLWAPSQMY